MGTPASPKLPPRAPPPPYCPLQPWCVSVWGPGGLKAWGMGTTGERGCGGRLALRSAARAHSWPLPMVPHSLVCVSPSLSHFRGFGFVTFADPASVDKVLGQPHHELDSKTVGSASPCGRAPPFQDRPGPDSPV